MSKQGTLPKDQAKLRAAATKALTRVVFRADSAYFEATLNHPGRARQLAQSAAAAAIKAQSLLIEWQTLRAKGEPQEFTE